MIVTSSHPFQTTTSTKEETFHDDEYMDLDLISQGEKSGEEPKQAVEEIRILPTTVLTDTSDFYTFQYDNKEEPNININSNRIHSTPLLEELPGFTSWKPTTNTNLHSHPPKKVIVHRMNWKPSTKFKILPTLVSTILLATVIVWFLFSFFPIRRRTRNHKSKNTKQAHPPTLSSHLLQYGLHFLTRRMQDILFISNSISSSTSSSNFYSRIDRVDTLRGLQTQQHPNQYHVGTRKKNRHGDVQNHADTDWFPQTLGSLEEKCKEDESKMLWNQHESLSSSSITTTTTTSSEPNYYQNSWHFLLYRWIRRFHSVSAVVFFTCSSLGNQLRDWILHSTFYLFVSNVLSILHAYRFRKKLYPVYSYPTFGEGEDEDDRHHYHPHHEEEENYLEGENSYPHMQELDDEQESSLFFRSNRDKTNLMFHTMYHPDRPIRNDPFSFLMNDASSNDLPDLEIVHYDHDMDHVVSDNNQEYYPRCKSGDNLFGQGKIGPTEHVINTPSIPSITVEESKDGYGNIECKLRQCPLDVSIAFDCDIEPTFLKDEDYPPGWLVYDPIQQCVVTRESLRKKDETLKN